jgi:hypothetical protein
MINELVLVIFTFVSMFTYTQKGGILNIYSSFVKVIFSQNTKHLDNNAEEFTFRFEFDDND